MRDDLVARLPQHIGQYIFAFIIHTPVFDATIALADAKKGRFLYRDDSGHYYLCRRVMVVVCNACGSAQCTSDFCGDLVEEEEDAESMFLGDGLQSAMLEFYFETAMQPRRRRLADDFLTQDIPASSYFQIDQSPNQLKNES
jgi:hypothetical protein